MSLYRILNSRNASAFIKGTQNKNNYKDAARCSRALKWDNWRHKVAKFRVRVRGNVDVRIKCTHEEAGSLRGAARLLLR